MEAPRERASMDWSGQPNYPRPDYLSSSRKRLAPQLIYKGSILQAWNRKMGVALHSSFFATLPELREVPTQEADIAWFVYDLAPTEHGRLELVHAFTKYTRFEDALLTITRAEAGDEKRFVERLQKKLDAKLDHE
jgi:hypothetical protein